MSETELRMHLTAIRRIDPYALEILDSATHVAFYSFKDDEWVKHSIEGALFVIRRSGKPSHSMIVMNRLNTDNLIEPVSKGLDLQIQEPFLLYRNTRGRIMGIWFYDKEECTRLAQKLRLLLQESNSIGHHQSSGPVASQPIDIFSMLSKAQDDYNSNKGHNNDSALRNSEVASQSVMDFFAKAGGGSQLPVPPNSGMFGISPQHTTGSAPDPQTPLLLQRLMSNPAHSVEHIENQQRSLTPQEIPGLIERRNGGFDKHDLSQRQENCHRSNKKLNMHRGDSADHLENDVKFMRISSPKSSSPLATFLAGGEHVLDDSVRSVGLSAIQTDTPQKPALMPPTMFTSTAAPVPVPELEVHPEPLTRNQLLQAFNYLIKHDIEFVNKLHEAYVKSFSELVS